MEMLLIVMCMSVLGLALSALAFGAATNGLPAPDETAAPQPAAVLRQSVTPAFFAGDMVIDRVPVRVPIEVILSRLESHMRLEQAAAESFLMAPTLESLHSRTTSPLVH
jgi:hypothetical protein